MALSATTSVTTQEEAETNNTVSYDINLPYKPTSEAQHASAKARTDFPEYLPTWDKLWFEKCPDFEYHDPALRAEKEMPNLLHAGIQMKDVTPKMGTILTGVKLEELNNAARDELALLISNRKIVVFRDQKSFLQKGPGFQEDFM